MKTLAKVEFGDPKIFESPLTNVNQTGTYVSRILGAAYVIAGVSFFILLVFGAFTIITSAGNPEKAKQGRAAATSALIGFLLIFASYWIIQIVEVVTGIQIF